MKYLLALFFILIHLEGFTQDLNEKSDSIRYSLYIYYGCEDQIKKITDYSIENRSSGKIIEYKPDSLGICYVPKDTTTTLYLRARLVYSNLIIDNSKETIVDTIIVPPIYEAPIQNGFYIGPTYYQYYKCGERCYGFQKTFRNDGQLWQKGHFKRGHLKSLKYFYPNGFLASKTKKRLLNGCNISYDKFGNLIFKYKYFLFFSYYKFYDKETGRYLKHRWVGQYKQ